MDGKDRSLEINTPYHKGKILFFFFYLFVFLYFIIKVSSPLENVFSFQMWNFVCQETMYWHSFRFIVLSTHMLRDRRFGKRIGQTGWSSMLSTIILYRYLADDWYILNRFDWQIRRYVSCVYKLHSPFIH